MFRCLKCKKECEPLTIDAGGYEEIWGRKEWVPYLEDVSDCCRAEFEEEPED